MTPARPAPPWVTIPGCALQLVGVFLLPGLVSVPFALLFELTEVVETLPALLAFTAVLLAPITVLQIVGVLLKSRRELRWWRARGPLGPVRVLAVLHGHASVVTARGWLLLTGGLVVTVLALGVKWASLGVLAVLALLVFYLVVGYTLFVSVFFVRTLESGLQTDAGIGRRMWPAVAVAGDAVEERFELRHVPIPWGYLLVIEDPNPPRLRTETRFALGSGTANGVVEASSWLHATPRGAYRLGPARVAYQDLLGITRVSVASVATAELTVLPRIVPVVVVDPPRSPMRTPDIITRPHRQPTEDPFRFREYLPGDDVRRIQWRLSLRAGQLHVRLPEARETSTERVVLLLDSFLPPGKLLHAADGGEEILDALVTAWLGIARELVDRGNRVSLLAASSDPATGVAQLETVDARATTPSRWQDLGARVAWQSTFDLPAMLAHLGDGAHGVVVTARFTAPPPDPVAGASLTWLWMDPADALGKPDPHWLWDVVGHGPAALAWLFVLPYPVGSDQNHLTRRVRELLRIRGRWMARGTLRRVARRRAGRTLEELRARGDAIYRIERGPRAVRLVGLHARTR